MQVKEYNAEYTYDYNLDVVNIEIDQKYNHDETIDLDFGVFLDFDDNHLPVNLEIVSASKIMGVEKEFLLNPDGNVFITISKDIIEVEVTFKFNNESEIISMASLNELGFPNSQTSFAIA